MSPLNTALKSQSFPSMDERIAWALTILCLVLGLLLTLGVVSVQVAPISGWTWLAIVVAQVITAGAVAGAAYLSSRKRSAVEAGPSAESPSEGATSSHAPQA